MNIQELNDLLQKIEAKPEREKMFDLALALLDWLGLEQAEIGKPRLLAIDFVTLQRNLVPAPITGQPQLYRLTANEQNIHVRFAVLKKFKKEYINQLVDKEPGLATYQATMRGIVQPPGSVPYVSPEPYFLHFVTNGDYRELLVIISNGEQKRIVNFRRRLTVTQHNRVLNEWKQIGTKSKPEIAEIFWKSLDIKEVNREFYKLIKTCFDNLLDVVNLQQPHLPEEDVKQFAVRLIGRYLFGWFLKEKEIIPEKLLASNTIAEYRSSFYQKYLHRLFFNTLNEEVSCRALFSEHGKLEKYYSNIPYLNGGLFEQHPEDEFWSDLNLNDWLFSFVRVLEGFDFTVDESSSSYQQVAIDPEMLGRIFENLLASQNKETEKMASQRKAFGAFYTPREIVEYMVNESLKAYLEKKLMPDEIDDSTASMVNEPLYAYSGSLFADLEPKQVVMDFQPKDFEAEQNKKKIRENIEKLFSPDCKDNPFDKPETLKVRQALSEVTILDPACGSGAFPMGAMLRLMELRQIVGHGHRNSYDLKHEILSKNIFGVDIMPMAVEISRLRAWLSLVLETEFKPNDRKNNFGISALPNLDFKFVCANSLIDVTKDDYLQNRASEYLKQFEKLTTQYFRAYDQEKEQLKSEIEVCINDITQVHHNAIRSQEDKIIKESKRKGNGSRLKGIKDHQQRNQQQLELWQSYKNLFSNQPVGFFNIRYFFPMVGDGFDVVIGNPPYVQLQKDGGKLAEELKDSKYTTYERTGDLYCIFYERGIQLLKVTGSLCYITSNKWMRAGYGKTTRALFLKHQPVKLIDLGSGAFENATVDTNIMLVHKTSEPPAQSMIKALDLSKKPESRFFDHGKAEWVELKNLNTDSWNISNPIEQRIREKIEARGVPLKEWNVNINYGIKTGYNEAFIINGKKRTELIAKDPKSAEIIKPLLRGRDIKRYRAEFVDLWLIATFPSLNIDIDQYPAIKSYLQGFGRRLEQSGSEFIDIDGNKINTRKKTGNKWFETQDQINYYQEFEKEKIIYPNMTLFLPFLYDKNSFYTNQKCFIITSSKVEIDLRYLVGYLNSRISSRWIRENCPELQGGTRELSKIFFENIPIPIIKPGILLTIAELVEQIHDFIKVNADTTALERRIDELVFRLYDLTYEEVKVIVPDFWLSEEEYNRFIVTNHE